MGNLTREGRDSLTGDSYEVLRLKYEWSSAKPLVVWKASELTRVLCRYPDLLLEKREIYLCHL